MNSFLIIQTAFIGDVILATSLIEKLHLHFPEARIDFLVRRGNEKLLANHPKINKVLIWEKKTRKYSSLLQVIRYVQTQKYSAVINVQRYLSSGLITALSKSPLKIGFRKNPLSFLFKKKLAHRISGQHETSRNLSLIAELTDEKYVAPRLYPSMEDYVSIRQYQNKPYLCFAPTSVWETKQFPALKWVELILSQDERFNVYLLGGPGDKAACQEIVDMCGVNSVINLAGELSFLESAALIKGASMTYTNDSAPMHMASAMDAPVNAVYCSTIPSFGFGPLSIHSKVIESEENLVCKPCGLHGRSKCPLGHFNCAYTIKKEQFDHPCYDDCSDTEQEQSVFQV